MQGAHGMWELSVNKAHHADMVEDLLEALVAQLACPDLQVCILHSHCLCTSARQPLLVIGPASITKHVRLC